MLLNEFDIQGFSIMNSSRPNVETIKFVLEQVYKNKNYTLSNIVVITEAVKYHKGDILFTFVDDFNREHKGVYTTRDGKRIFNLFEDDDLCYVIPKYMYNVIKTTTSRQELLTILKEIVNNKEGKDEFWFALCDCLYTKYVYESEENQRKLKIQPTLDEIGDIMCEKLGRRNKTSVTTMSGETLTFSINLN